MIKVESNMLVLDNSFSKEDVLAIDEFMKIVEKRTEERIIKRLETLRCPENGVEHDCTDIVDTNVDSLIALIKGEK